MQLAAHEAKRGHDKLAEELRALIDEVENRNSVNLPIPIERPKGELARLLAVSYPKSRLNDIVLDDELNKQFMRVIAEQRHTAKFLQYGLSPKRKMLFIGSPGTGKMLSANILAGEMGLPLCVIRLDALTTRFMGKTVAKLNQLFDLIAKMRGVYFFDEFNAIESQNCSDNDMWQIRRMLNNFLLMIEQDQSQSVIIAAKTHHRILDHALFRRFDDVLHYYLPDTKQIVALLKTKLRNHVIKRISWENLAEKASGLSHADISRTCEEAIKNALIRKETAIAEIDVCQMIEERQHTISKLY